MICAARNGAQAVSVTKWSVRLERSEDAQMIATGPQTRESVPRARDSRWEAQSPRRKPRQEALRNLGSAVMGVSKTVPPASTREETSSLQKPTPHAVLASLFSLLPFALALPIRVPLGEQAENVIQIRPIPSA